MTKASKPPTKAELREMLTEAVRNTQPAPKRTAKIRSVRASAKPQAARPR
jgi:hypothetical protein